MDLFLALHIHVLHLTMYTPFLCLLLMSLLSMYIPLKLLYVWFKRPHTTLFTCRKESAQDTLQTLPQPKKSKSSRCCATKHLFSQALPLELLMTCQEQSSPQNIMSSNPVRDIPNEMQNELSVLSQQSLLDDGNHVSGSNPLSTTQNFLSIFSNVPKNQMSQRKPPNLQPILMPTSQKNSSGHDLVKFSVGDNDINFDVVDERERTRKEVISEPHETAGPQYDAVLTEDGFIRTRKRPRKRSIVRDSSTFYNKYLFQSLLCCILCLV